MSKSMKNYTVAGPNGIILGKCSSKTTNTEKLESSWMINDYSSYDTKGEELRSPIFTSAIRNITHADCKWFLLLEPNGEVESKKSVLLGLGLDCCSPCSAILVNFNMFILDSQQNKINLSKLGNRILRFYPGRKGTISDWWYAAFILKNDLFTDNCLPNDELTIYFEGTLSGKESSFNILDQSTISNDLDYRLLEHNLSADFERLFMSQDFTDVTLAVNNKYIKAHEFVLSARSTVFAAMLKTDMKENKSNQIEITDIDEEIIEEMLYYMYTEKFKNLDRLAIHLLGVADKYAIEGMKAECEEALLRNLSVENAADTLVMANLYRANELKSGTINFIIMKSTEVMDTETWDKIVDSNPRLINEVCRRALFRN